MSIRTQKDNFSYWRLLFLRIIDLLIIYI